MAFRKEPHGLAIASKGSRVALSQQPFLSVDVLVLGCHTMIAKKERPVLDCLTVLREEIHSQAVFVLPEPGDKVGSVLSSAPTRVPSLISARIRWRAG